jgi:hypothetical protein
MNFHWQYSSVKTFDMQRFMQAELTILGAVASEST